MPDEKTHLTLDISEGGTAGKVGNVLSSRLPIRYRDADGKTVTGFFTTNEFVDARQIALTRSEGVVRSAADQYPELAEFYDRLKDGNTFFIMAQVFSREAEDIGFDRRAVKNMKTLENSPYLKEFLERQMWMLNFPGDAMKRLRKAERAGTSPNLSGLLNAMLGVVQSFIGGISLERTHENIHFQQSGSNVNRRNDLMSKHAEALGVPNLVAKSREMTVVQNGETLQGTFMDLAEGVVRENFHPDTPGFSENGVPKKIELSLTGFQDICALQILDYLDGNVDRHSGNMVYDLDTSDPNVIRIRGVKAIDNDASFGIQTHVSPIKRAKTSTLADLQVIDRAMAEKVLAMTPESMVRDFHLAGLNANEFDMAVFRLKNLQEELRKGDASRIKILDTPAKWEEAFQNRNEIAVENLGTQSLNALAAVNHMIELHNAGKYGDHTPAKPMNFTGYAKQVSSLRDVGRLSAYVSRLRELQDYMDRDNLGNLKTYDQIENAIAALEKVSKAIDSRAARSPSAVLRGQMTDMERNMLSEVLGKIPGQMDADLAARSAKRTITAQQRYLRDTVHDVIGMIRQGVREESRMAEQELAQQMDTAVRSMQNPDVPTVQIAVQKMTAAEREYVPLQKSFHTFSTMSSRLPDVQSRVRGSSPQFDAMVAAFTSAGDTTQMKNPVQRMALMNQVADAAQRYLDYKIPDGKTDGLKPYSAARVKYAMDMLEYAKTGVSQAKRDQRMIGELVDMRKFVERCKDLTAHLQAGAPQERIAQDKEEFLQGYEKLLTISERYADKQPVQTFCASACESGAVKAYVDAYTAHLQRTTGNAGPCHLKNLGLSEDTMQRQKTLSERARAFPKQPEAKPAGKAPKAPVKAPKTNAPKANTL